MTLVINNFPHYVTPNDIANFVETNTGYLVGSVRTTNSRVSQGALCAWITMKDDAHERTAALSLNGKSWGSHKITTAIPRPDLTSRKNPPPVTLAPIIVGIGLIICIVVIFAIMIGTPVQIIVSLIGGGLWMAIRIGN
jgi:hypothetical protein